MWPIVPLATVTIGLVDSLIDNFIKDNVTPIAGSLVYCDLYAFEHSGIAINEEEIVHLNGDGRIEVVSHRQFLRRLNGFNNALSIYVSSYKNQFGDVYAVGSQAVANRAKALIGTRTNYHLVFNNCHSFSARCLSEKPELILPTFSSLKKLAEKELGAECWRVAQ